MSARRKSNAVAVAVEAQAADLRQLADEIRFHCDNDTHFFVTRRRQVEIGLMRRWADDLVEIGNALTLALADDDRAGVRRLFKKSAAFGLFVAGVIGFASDSLSIQDRFVENYPAEECVARLVARSEAVEEELGIRTTNAVNSSQETGPSETDLPEPDLSEDGTSETELPEEGFSETDPAGPSIERVDDEILGLVERSVRKNSSIGDGLQFGQDPMSLLKELRSQLALLESKPEAQHRLSVVIDALAGRQRTESGYGVLRVAREALKRRP